MTNDVKIHATVDEIETDQSGNQFAVLVLDDGQQLVLPVERLPDGCREGTVLKVEFGIEHETTRDRLEETRSRQQRIFGKRSSDRPATEPDKGT